jgi:hypothetical protein
LPPEPRLDYYFSLNFIYSSGIVGIEMILLRLRLEVENNIGAIPRAFDEGYYLEPVTLKIL